MVRDRIVGMVRDRVMVGGRGSGRVRADVFEGAERHESCYASFVYGCMALVLSRSVWLDRSVV